MRVPFAVWKPVPYRGLARRTNNKAAVMHTNGGKVPAGGSLYNWWVSVANSGSTVGAHFQVTNAGVVEQYVDTDYVIGHAYSANGWSVGIETEDDGDPGRAWTQLQQEAIVKLLKALSVPPVILADHPSDGVGWHMEYVDWNHDAHNCPGDVRVAQIKTIIIPALKGGVDDMPLTQTDQGGLNFLWGASERAQNPPKPVDKNNELPHERDGWNAMDKILKAADKLLATP